MKRWCDAGSIPVIRTLGGHRRITLDGLQNFLRETERTLINPDVLGLPNLSLGRRTSIPGAEDPLRSEFRDALASGDEGTCWQLMQQQIEQGKTRTETAEELITDAMHGIGESWDQHQIDVYQERRSCQITQRLIFQLRAQLPAPIPMRRSRLVAHPPAILINCRR